MKITIECDLPGEELPTDNRQSSAVSPQQEVYEQVAEFVLVGTQIRQEFPKRISRSHLRQSIDPFDLIEKLEGVKCILLRHACQPVIKEVERPPPHLDRDEDEG